MVKGKAKTGAPTASQRAKRLRRRNEEKQRRAVESVKKRVDTLQEKLKCAKAEQARLRAKLEMQEFTAKGYTHISMEQFDEKISKELLPPRVEFINKCVKMLPHPPEAFMLSNTFREEFLCLRSHINVLQKKGHNTIMTLMWHGIKGETPKRAMEGIANVGFQEMPGSRHVMGHGAYFSANPVTAYSYSKNSSGVRVVMVCLGVVGGRETTVGKPDLRVLSNFKSRTGGDGKYTFMKPYALVNQDVKVLGAYIFKEAE